MSVAELINTVGEYCGKRDIAELTGELADVFVLFGGSVAAGGDVLAEAIRRGTAKKYVIIGGEGHTTAALREKMREFIPGIKTDGMAESELFDAYIGARYGCRADYTDTRSTNCGNNITNLLELIEKNGIPFKRVILSQDATMQRRMEATLRKYTRESVEIISYATYRAEVAERDGRLVYRNEIRGMWDIDRYVNLLMGEIPRLTDDENGYGPRGRGYLAHVDIPDNVKNAFSELCAVYGGATREANPLYGRQRG